ncbi:MAG: chemotaxis protein CheX [Planctomycetes bacterium]|nr:chemotaxis protein CheX [Planctomycetota bacterium]
MAEAVLEATSETLENMAFMEAVMAECRLDDFADQVFCWSAVPVLEPVKGTVTLMMSKSLAAMLTSAIMGLFDEEPEDTIICDSLAEVANTIAGRFVAMISPDDVTFKLGVPVTACGAIPVGEGIYSNVCIDIEDDHMCVRISGEDILSLLPKD